MKIQSTIKVIREEMEERRVKKNIEQKVKIRKAIKSYSEEEWHKVTEENFFEDMDVDSEMFCKFH